MSEIALSLILLLSSFQYVEGGAGNAREKAIFARQQRVHIENKLARCSNFLTPDRYYLLAKTMTWKVEPMKNRVIVAKNGSISWNGTRVKDDQQFRFFLDATIQIAPQPVLLFESHANDARTYEIKKIIFQEGVCA